MNDVDVKNPNVLEAKAVKSIVADDLKARNLNYTDVAKKIGLSRQTVAAILSSDDYFTEKQATLFNLAWGYNKRFLMNGIAPLLSNSASEQANLSLELTRRVLKLYRDANFVQGVVIKAISKCAVSECSEDCKQLVGEVRQLRNLLSMIYSQVQDNELADELVMPFIESSEPLISKMSERVLLLCNINFCEDEEI